MERMSGLDAAFLYAETPAMHLHAVGIIVMEGHGPSGPVGYDEVAELIGSRLAVIPPFRRRAVAIPGGIDHPMWVEDPDFNLAHHLHAATVRAPGSNRELAAFAAHVASVAIDRRRPLWEMWFVDGLAGGSVAIVAKFHHAIMDGAGAGDLLARLFDLSPEPAPPPPDDWAPEPIPSGATLVSSSLVSLAARQRRFPRAAAETVGSLAGTVRTWTTQRLAGSAAPLTAPRTAFNGSVSSHRAVALRQVALERVLETRRAFETKVNAVILAAAAGALRGYLAERSGVPDRPLICSVPVANAASRSANEFGNHLSAMLVPLPLDDLDPVERLRLLQASSQNSKQLQVSLGPEILGRVTAFAPPALVTGASHLYGRLHLARLHPPVSNLVVSNVAGPAFDLYCAGARLTAVYPLGPVMDSMGLNITVLSLAGELNIGLIACAELVDDIEELGDRYVAALDELSVRAKARNARRAAPAPERRSRRQG